MTSEFPKFNCICAQRHGTIVLSAPMSHDPDFEDFGGPCSLFEMSDDDVKRRKIEGWVYALAIDAEDRPMALTYDRQFFRPALDGPSEKMPAPSPGLAAGLCGLRGIGSGIYACGGNGLLFRRSADNWHPFAPELLTPFPSDPQNEFVTVNGPDEKNIYILAGRTTFFWDGTTASQISSLPHETYFVSLDFADVDEIWICGWHGALFKGNARDGFTRIPNRNRQMFLSVAVFEGQVFLAGNGKLWVYDKGQITPVDLGREKIPQIRCLTRTSEALWAAGDTIFKLMKGKWKVVPVPPF